MDSPNTRPMMRSFEVPFTVYMNELLNKKSSCRYLCIFKAGDVIVMAHSASSVWTRSIFNPTRKALQAGPVLQLRYDAVVMICDNESAAFCHWLKALRQRQIGVGRQGPGPQGHNAESDGWVHICLTVGRIHPVSGFHNEKGPNEYHPSESYNERHM